MGRTRGFITVATGDYYCGLAKSLAMSYRLFSKTEYPLYVLTDRQGEKLLKKYFDGVIVMEEPTYTFLDKLSVYEKSPFDETLFIDADMHILRDISFLFDAFKENDSPVDCIGSLIEITDTVRPIHFGDAAIEAFGLTHYMAFNGGVYYYQKCQKTDEFFRFIYDDLIPNYHRYQMKVFRAGQMADEPLIGLAMVVYKFTPFHSDVDIMKLVQDMKTLSWDMEKQVCSMIWYQKKVSPILLHYGTHNTRHKKYVYYKSRVWSRYHKAPVLFPFYLIGAEVRLGLLHLSRAEDRKQLSQWIGAHFTKKYWSNLFHRFLGR